jgi:hypothetical protein
MDGWHGPMVRLVLPLVGYQPDRGGCLAGGCLGEGNGVMPRRPAAGGIGVAGGSVVVRRTGWTLGLVAGLYFIGRAAVEVFVIDVADSASYREDWGGPSLAGVLAVHCGPGIVAAVAVSAAVIHRRAVRRTTGQHTVDVPPA